MKYVLINYGSRNSSDASAELTFLGCVRTYFLTRPAPKTNPFGTKTGAQDGHGQIYSFRIRFAAGSAPRKDEKRREEALNLYSKTKKQHFLRHVYLLEIDMAICPKVPSETVHEHMYLLETDMVISPKAPQTLKFEHEICINKLWIQEFIRRIRHIRGTDVFGLRPDLLPHAPHTRMTEV